MALKRRRKSKLDPFVDQLGRVPDRVIADQAGVTPENVRAYRTRRGIAAGWRGARMGVGLKVDSTQSEDVAAVPSGPAATSPQGRPRSKASGRGFHPRRSRLDPYSALLGDVADSELAAKAGVTVENVRAYRRRRGIPARWRQTSALRQEVADAPPSEQAGLKPQAWAYRAVAALGGEKKEFVVLGSCMAEAASGVERRLRERHRDVQLMEITLLGEALQ